jgi:acyl-CoA synthetase (NDP forming)
MSPRSVAVVGASERPQHGSVAFQNLLGGGCAGDVYAINPRSERVHGQPCYPDFANLPRMPECAVFAIPARAVPAILDEGGRLGLRSAVIFSAGFAEAGAAGEALQREIASIAARHGIAVCGPNCMGIVNTVGRIAMYTGKMPASMPRGRLGVVSQSGSVTYMLLSAARVDVSYAISSGNQAVLSVTDYLEFLIDDGDTDTIALFIESIADGPRFLAAVARAREARKPIIVCKTGRTARAAEAMRAHTGALAGSHEVFSAIARQYGLVQVDELDELVEVAALLSSPRRLSSGRGIGAIACSGGENALVVDVCESLALDFPPLADETSARLRAELPDFATVMNPLDVTGALFYNPAGYVRCIRALAADPAIGMVVSVQDIPGGAKVPPEGAAFLKPIVDATVEAAQAIDKPVAFLTNVSGDVDEGLRRILIDGGVPVLEGTRKGFQAIARFMAWSRAVTSPPPEVMAAPPLSGAITATLRGGGLGEVEAKGVLRAIGLPVIRGEAAGDVDSAVAVARRIGFPVVLKIDSHDVLHKTDLGGVALGLASEAAVREAFGAVIASVRARAPAAHIRGVLVEEMAPPGVELVLGMKRDECFGPMILLGLGGVFVEALEAFVLRRAPFGRDVAEAMIAELPGRVILDGVRGAPPADIPALIDALVKFSIFAAATSQHVQEIDLNPVRVLQRGQGVRILDAVFV